MRFFRRVHASRSVAPLVRSEEHNAQSPSMSIDPNTDSRVRSGTSDDLSSVQKRQHRPPVRRVSTGSLLSIGKSSRAIYEWQVKTASYEAMIQRFQLRKIPTEASQPKFVSKNIVIDKTTRKRNDVMTRFSFRRWFRSLWMYKASIRKVLTLPLTPHHCLTKVHSVVMLIVYHFQVFYLPFSTVYFPSGTSLTTAVNITLEVIMMIDMAVRFNTAYMEKNILVTSQRQITKHYLCGWFLLDLVSSLPVHLLLYCSTGSHVQTNEPSLVFDQLARLPRLVHLRLVLNAVLFSRVLRIGKDFLAWLLYSRYSHLLAIAQLLWLVLMTSHYIACFWHVVAGPNDSDAGVLDKYVTDFYYAICLIQGQGNSGGTLAQNAFSTMAVLIGSVILAIVFGNYYVHLWEEYESLDGDIVKFSRELTHTLRLEVGLFKYMNLVVDIPFWKNCSPDFVTQIVLSLVVRVYLPDDYVIRKGEVGDEMFMINRGICEVLDATRVSDEGLAEGALSSHQTDDRSDSNDDVARTHDLMTPATSRFGSHASENEDDVDTNLSRVKAVRPRLRRRIPNRNGLIRMYPGHAFGEMSLIMNYARTANIRAASYVEMCVLRRRDFQALICRQEDRTVKSCIDKKDIPFPWEQICDVVVLRRRTSFGRNSTREDVEKTLDSSEAAVALVERINVDLIDESIKYGFQGFDKPLEDQLPPTRLGPSITNSLLGVGKSSRDIYEWQVKTANYEAMMQRFQLRKVASGAATPPKFDSRRIVIDKATNRRKDLAVRFSIRRWMRSLWKHDPQKKMLPLTPHHFLTKVHNVFYLPFSVVYYPDGTRLTTAINIALEVIMMVDVLVQFNTAYLDKNTLVTSYKKISKQYLRRWFLLDLFSSLPVHLVQYCTTGSYAQTGAMSLVFDQLARLSRLVHLRIALNAVLFSRMLRVGKDSLAWLMYSRYSHLLGIAQLMWLVLMTSHYIACFWHVVSAPSASASDGDSDDSVLNEYVADFYYAICLNQGQGNSGGTLAQNAFSTMAVLIGSVILAIVFGNVAMLVSNFNANETNYQRKMEAVFATMSKMHLPRELGDRIHQYYVHLWEEYESLDGDIVKFSRELTHTLRLEVGLFKYMNLVVDIPFWKNCSPDFVTQIVLSLVVRVYLPDDYVIRKGEVGDEMFMINRGICEVLDATRVSDEGLAEGRLSSHISGNAFDSDDEDDERMTTDHALTITSRLGSERSQREDHLASDNHEPDSEPVRPRLRR
ncbi:TPA: hypothetical protein N0F65_009831 [Lagenidium giganteum]|uniref:Cyclic nucleotide-binding domain-containing protein n=1 Tax=Lagenidium giganteum TaxID=4803 RepID=A0AAV2YVN8_9STRA|nr:TPA: hypothetical protein N0F65_009831 [Lagenidium giganteum]